MPTGASPQQLSDASTSSDADRLPPSSAARTTLRYIVECPDQYNLGDNWKVWSLSFRVYLEAIGGLSDREKKLALLAALSLKAMDELQAVCEPNDPLDDSVTFNELMHGLDKRFIELTNDTLERNKFFQLKMGTASLKDFASALKEAAATCRFPSTHYEMALTDGFILGVPENVRAVLIREKPTSLDSALEIAESVRLSESSIQALSQSSADLRVNLVQQREKKKQKQQQHQHRKRQLSPVAGSVDSASRCVSYGQTDRRRQDCRHRQTVCNYCKKKGHLEAVCRSKQDSSSDSSSESSSDSSSESSSQPLSRARRRSEKVTCVQPNRIDTAAPPFTVLARLEGYPVELEFDCGAGVSIIPRSIWKLIQKPALRPTATRCFTYTGEMIQVDGEAMINVSINNRSATVPVLVAPTSHPLMGRSWFATFDIDLHKSLQHLTTPPHALTAVNPINVIPVGSPASHTVAAIHRITSLPLPPRVNMEDDVNGSLTSLTLLDSHAEEFTDRSCSCRKLPTSPRLPTSLRLPSTPTVAAAHHVTPPPLPPRVKMKHDMGGVLTLSLNDYTEELADRPHSCRLFQASPRLNDDADAAFIKSRPLLHAPKVTAEGAGHADGRTCLSPGENDKLNDDRRDADVNPLTVITGSQATSPDVSTASVPGETQKDDTLQRVCKAIDASYLHTPVAALLLYDCNRHDLHVNESCPRPGTLTVSRPPLPTRALDTLLQTQPGIVTMMKRHWRLHSQWPSPADDIAAQAQDCTSCAEALKAPTTGWPPTQPLIERVTTDSTDLTFHKGQSLLLLVDSYVKWLDVNLLTATTSKATTAALSDHVLTLFGHFRSLTTDNRRQFTSEKHAAYCEPHGIHHLFTAGYHFRSTDQVGRDVDMVKQALLKQELEGGSVKGKLPASPTRHHLTLLKSTGQSPAELFRPENIPPDRHQLYLTLMAPSEEKNAHHAAKHRPLAAGDRAPVNDDHRYQRANAHKGDIVHLKGHVLHNVQSNGQLHSLHANQLLPDCSPLQAPSQESPLTPFDKGARQDAAPDDIINDSDFVYTDAISDDSVNDDNVYNDNVSNGNIVNDDDNTDNDSVYVNDDALFAARSEPERHDRHRQCTFKPPQVSSLGYPTDMQGEHADAHTTTAITKISPVIPADSCATGTALLATVTADLHATGAALLALSTAGTHATGTALLAIVTASSRATGAAPLAANKAATPVSNQAEDSALTPSSPLRRSNRSTKCVPATRHAP